MASTIEKQIFVTQHTPRTFGTDENSKNHLAQNIKASTGYESKTLGESESAPTEKESISAHSKTKSKPLRPTTPPQKSFTPNSQPPTSNPNPPYYRNPPPIRHLLASRVFSAWTPAHATSYKMWPTYHKYIKQGFYKHNIYSDNLEEMETGE